MYSKNLKFETVFLTTATTHKPTKKLNKERPIDLIVNANVPTLRLPLIIPHLRFLNSCLFDV